MNSMNSTPPARVHFLVPRCPLKYATDYPILWAEGPFCFFWNSLYHLLSQYPFAFIFLLPTPHQTQTRDPLDYLTLPYKNSKEQSLLVNRIVLFNQMHYIIFNKGWVRALKMPKKLNITFFSIIWIGKKFTVDRYCSFINFYPFLMLVRASL